MDKPSPFQNQAKLATAGVDPRNTRTAGATVMALLSNVAHREAETSGCPPMSADVLAFVLNIQSAPTLIIDRHLRILFANTAAENALRQGGTLKRQGQDLVLHTGAARRFAEFVNAASRGCPLRRSLILDGHPGSHDVAVWFRPVDQSLQSSSVLWSQGLVVVSVQFLSRPPAVATALLRQHYKLTMRQAEVASRLAHGATLAKLEVDMGITIATLRSHLSRIFEKTRTECQSELVSLVLSLRSPVIE
jgi:DNA-binding CsgD family transcriptional regulator